LLKLYTLIWKRFIASQMSEAQFSSRKVTLEGEGYTLSATGTTLLFDGFKRVYDIVEEPTTSAKSTKAKRSSKETAEQEEGQERSVTLPEQITQGARVPLNPITPKQHFTQPPPRFNEASLVKELEKEGIGRPSTYATILKTIQARAYTELDDKKRFIPTELGIAVTKALTEHMAKIMNTSFTAEMEEDLDKIAHGELARDTLLHTFYQDFSAAVATFKKHIGIKQLEKTEILCPSCNKEHLVIRFGKAGPFVGCPRYPECTFTSNFSRGEDNNITLVEAAPPVVLNEACPRCHKPLRQIVGRYGPFIACSGYPECKYIHQIKAAFPCPQCGKAITKKSWKGKTFWGCAGYPKCTFSISGDIVETPCPQCAAPYLRLKESGSKQVQYCPHSKECGYQEETKNDASAG
jgi:DNA topoisomerase-1